MTFLCRLYTYQHNQGKTMKYVGNCTNENVINDIFGSVTEFAQLVEENGNEFLYNGYEITYDEKTDIHSFWN